MHSSGSPKETPLKGDALPAASAWLQALLADECSEWLAAAEAMGTVRAQKLDPMQRREQCFTQGVTASSSMKDTAEGTGAPASGDQRAHPPTGLPIPSTATQAATQN